MPILDSCYIYISLPKENYFNVSEQENLCSFLTKVESERPLDLWPNEADKSP